MENFDPEGIYATKKAIKKVCNDYGEYQDSILPEYSDEELDVMPVLVQLRVLEQKVLAKVRKINKKKNSGDIGSIIQEIKEEIEAFEKDYELTLTEFEKGRLKDMKEFVCFSIESIGIYGYSHLFITEEGIVRERN